MRFPVLARLSSVLMCAVVLLCFTGRLLVLAFHQRSPAELAAA